MVEFRSLKLGECSKSKHQTTNDSIKVVRDLESKLRTTISTLNVPTNKLAELQSLDSQQLNTSSIAQISREQTFGSFVNNNSDNQCNAHLESLPSESENCASKQRSRDQVSLADDPQRMLPDQQTDILLSSTRTRPAIIQQSDTATIVDDKCDKTISGYQLRALSDNISTVGPQSWTQVSILQQNIHASTLSTELITETLNYFLTCGKRVSQMTKTYDDSDAYILLLQEKEVDLELAARIGQDLLKQNKQLRENIKGLEEELLLRQEEVQQLKHELSSKTTLLDTFIEEEEEQQQQHQTSQSALIEEYDLKQPSQHNPVTADSATQQHWSSNDLSKPQDPIRVEEKNAFRNTDECSEENQKLVQNVTVQLLKSNKRLCELQDELFYKNEQNSMQQEDIRQLREQLQATELRVNTLISENEILNKTVVNSEEMHREITDELKVCKRNFSELLRAFLELQKESRTYRNRLLQEKLPNEDHLADLEPSSDTHNISYDSLNTTSFNTLDSTPYDFTTGSNFNSFTSSAPPTLQEELEESMRGRVEIREDAGAECRQEMLEQSVESDESEGRELIFKDSEEGDEASANSILSGETIGSSSVDENNNWMGLSSFMITTLMLLCISVTFTSSSYNVTPKLPIKLDK